jgi:hypothetical protein
MESVFERAIRDALAVYYFPAMDDWNRAIVRPLAIKGFDRSMTESRTWRGKWASLTAAEQQEFEDNLEAGHAMLDNYFAWAAAIDDFDSLFADHDVWAPISDPEHPGQDLGTLDGRPMRYMGRMDQLISDPDDELWVVEHRVVRGGWTAEEVLVDDEVMRGLCWYTQIAYPQMLIAGSVTNELRVDGQLDSSPVDEIVERDRRTMIGSRHVQTRRSPQSIDPASTPAARSAATAEDHVVGQQGNGLFQRTVVRRNQASMREAGTRVAEVAARLRDPDLPVPPTFSARCGTCQFKAPCDVMEAGGDWQTLLDSRFFARDPDAEDESLRHSDHRAGVRASMARTYRATEGGHR